MLTMGNDEINDDGDDIVDEVKCCKYFWENYKLTNLWALFYGFSHKNRLKWKSANGQADEASKTNETNAWAGNRDETADEKEQTIYCCLCVFVCASKYPVQHINPFQNFIWKIAHKIRARSSHIYALCEPNTLFSVNIRWCSFGEYRFKC